MVIYEDKNVLVVDKPAGVSVFPEGNITEKTFIESLLKEFPALAQAGSPPRYGIAHRLDKETSGILLIAKNNKTLEYLQKEFKERRVEKKYLTLVAGIVKDKEGVIETLIGRGKKDRKKQKVYLSTSPDSFKKGLRPAKTYWKIVKRLKNFTLLEASPKTGRKHQIRVHLAYIGHPVAGDKLYSFKGQPILKGLNRQFLHAHSLEIEMLDKKKKKFVSGLPKDLNNIIKQI